MLPESSLFEDGGKVLRAVRFPPRILYYNKKKIKKGTTTGEEILLMKKKIKEHVTLDISY